MSLPHPDAVIQALESSPRGQMKPKELSKALSVPKQEYRDFKGLLRELVNEGRLYRIKGNRYALPRKMNLVKGRVRGIRSGDAFLQPEDPSQGDIFIPGSHLDSAMDGDRVAVRVEGRPKGRKPVGRVVQIVERGRPTIVGTFHRARNFGIVNPHDPKLTRDVFVPEGREKGARDGDVVVVRITVFGDRTINPAGDVETVLGPASAPGVDVLAILHGHGLAHGFPREVEDEAERIRQEGLEGAVEAREDVRHLRVFTIDPSDARDHDDALSIEALDGKNWEVGIHIADVSHYVQEGSLLDLEAYRRGTSIYLVDQVVPMLPHPLSSDICSLRPDEDRLAVSLFCQVDEEGRIRRHRLTRSVIRSRFRLSYEEVEDVLSRDGSVEEGLDQDLRTLSALARAIRERRSSRGSLDFDLPEARVVLDEEGVPVDIQKKVQQESHRLVEDFMITANEVLARDAENRKLPVPYRVHESPDPDQLDHLRQFLSSVGHSLPRGSVGSTQLQEVLERVRGRPEETLVTTVILRSMKRARYSPDNIGHFGLGSRAYAHFTSPIRRYPDLVVHRVLTRALVDGLAVPEEWGGEALQEMTDHASEREDMANQAERDSVDMKKIEFMERHLGDEFDGTIANVTSFGFFVLLDRYFVEGLVHVSSLEDDYYNFNPEGYSLVGERSGRRFRLGDRVRVRVARVSKEDRHIDFLLCK